MALRAPESVLCLLTSLALSTGALGLARADTKLYTGSVRLLLWGTQIPYGASLSRPRLANAPSGDLASVIGKAPAAFTLPPGQLTLTTSLFELPPPSRSWSFRSTKFSGANDAGSFFGGGGPGSTGFTPVPSIPASQFGISFSGEPDRFGGVMKLLGRFDYRVAFGGTCGYCPYHTVIPLSPVGGPFGGTATAMTYVGGTAFPPTFVTATAWGFPWTTGNVGAVAAVVPTASPTTTSAQGSDLRTASGLGTLQLVTPFVVRVKSRPEGCADCDEQWFYAGTARAELHFVPEPASTVLLAAGLGGLTALFRWSRRRHPLRGYRDAARR
jgi:hypothetical protein